MLSYIQNTRRFNILIKGKSIEADRIESYKKHYELYLDKDKE